MNNWLPLTIDRKKTHEGIQARFTISQSSPWFSGHFPGFPLLPGIAQLYMAFQAVRDLETEQGRDVTLEGFKRIRFRKMIIPGETIDLSVTRDSAVENRYGFTITVDGDIASSGSMIIKEKK